MQGAFSLGLLEQVAHLGRAHADEHLHELRAGDGEERHAASPATALASRVLPVPGGPTSSTPLGIFAECIVPMSLEEKLEFYEMLVKIGFKEIEVGFPAASDTEYEFLRTLIEGNRIPEDVTVQVLTQCRDHIIRKTFEAVKGAPRAVIHFYNSTSVAQREQVFHKSRKRSRRSPPTAPSWSSS